MLSLWNLYLLLPLSLPLSLHVIAFDRETVRETQESDSDTQPLKRPHGSVLAAGGTENFDLLGLPLSWPLSSYEESDSRGVIGEYTDLQESTETFPSYSEEKGLIISRTTGATEDASSKASAQPQPTQEQQTRTVSFLQSKQTAENEAPFPDLQDDTTDSRLPFLLSGSIPSVWDSTSALPAGPGPSPERTTQPVPTGGWGWTTGPSVVTQERTQVLTVPAKETKGVLSDITDPILYGGAVSIEENKGKSLSWNEMKYLNHLLNLTPIKNWCDPCHIWSIVVGRNYNVALI